MNRFFRRLFPDKERRAYNRMYRRHRKELVKHAKKTGEWDWCWLHQSVIMQIRHMYEYYSEGNNVWQVDESRLQIVEQLKHVLDLDAEIDRVSNDLIEDFKKREEREQGLYEELYSSIGKNIRWWWD